MVRSVIACALGIVLGLVISAGANVTKNLWDSPPGNDRFATALRTTFHTGYTAGVLDMVQAIALEAQTVTKADASHLELFISGMMAINRCMKDHQYVWPLADYTHFAEVVMFNSSSADADAPVALLLLPPLMKCPAIK